MHSDNSPQSFQLSQPCKPPRDRAYVRCIEIDTGDFSEIRNFLESLPRKNSYKHGHHCGFDRFNVYAKINSSESLLLCLKFKNVTIIKLK